MKYLKGEIMLGYLGIRIKVEKELVGRGKTYFVNK